MPSIATYGFRCCGFSDLPAGAVRRGYGLVSRIYAWLRSACYLLLRVAILFVCVLRRSLLHVRSYARPFYIALSAVITAVLVLGR